MKNLWKRTSFKFVIIAVVALDCYYCNTDDITKTGRVSKG